MAGFACGCAMLVEYTAALGAIALLAYALSDPELRGKAWTGALAALPPLLLLALYNNAAFGSPLAIGYMLSWTNNNWNLTFYVSAAIYLTGIIFWLLLDPVTPLEPERKMVAAEAA